MSEQEIVSTHAEPKPAIDPETMAELLRMKAEADAERAVVADAEMAVHADDIEAGVQDLEDVANGDYLPPLEPSEIGGAYGKLTAEAAEARDRNMPVTADTATAMVRAAELPYGEDSVSAAAEELLQREDETDDAYIARLTETDARHRELGQTRMAEAVEAELQKMINHTRRQEVLTDSEARDFLDKESALLERERLQAENDKQELEEGAEFFADWAEDDETPGAPGTVEEYRAAAQGEAVSGAEGGYEEDAAE
jgi:hypothetical protein